MSLLCGRTIVGTCLLLKFKRFDNNHWESGLHSHGQLVLNQNGLVMRLLLEYRSPSIVLDAMGISSSALGTTCVESLNSLHPS